eukprot:CAMPEP_0118935424 /NCGR_PEP_ID=MMETSP1169-20130426/15638_1 /TAXON_ID=36882 /ORGANISM="Pyramimonas obovata, Strain CCMP722" /LENGTH=124 /DNA_ID=CAMNT_0006878465 /DNA_START=176 /DNA_END=550 /DNA_ORIENTATION=-
MYVRQELGLDEVYARVPDEAGESCGEYCGGCIVPASRAAKLASCESDSPPSLRLPPRHITICPGRTTDLDVLSWLFTCTRKLGLQLTPLFSHRDPAAISNPYILYSHSAGDLGILQQDYLGVWA